jgi:hypothetical protein
MSTTSSKALVTVHDAWPNASTAVPTASITTHIAEPSNITDNSTTTNAETASMSVDELAGK